MVSSNGCSGRQHGGLRKWIGVVFGTLTLAVIGMAAIPDNAAADATGIYVTNLGSDVVRWENLDGLNRWDDLPDSSGYFVNPFGIAFDIANHFVYVVTTGGAVFRSTPGGWSGGYVESCGNLGGLLAGPRGIALDLTQGKMYVTNFTNGKVIRASLNGSGAEDLGNMNVTLFGPDGIALDIPNQKMYIANYGGNTVTSANMDGSGAVSLGNLNNTLNGPAGIALDLLYQKMYVVNRLNNTITRANMDGSGAVSLGNLNNTLNSPEGIALDVWSNKMYVTNLGNNTITQASLAGSGGIVWATSAAGFSTPESIALQFPLYTISPVITGDGGIVCTPLQVAEMGNSECEIGPSNGSHLVDVTVNPTSNPSNVIDLGAITNIVFPSFITDWDVRATFSQNYFWLLLGGAYKTTLIGVSVDGAINSAATQHYDEIRAETGTYQLVDIYGQNLGLTCDNAMAVPTLLSGGWDNFFSRSADGRTSVVGPLTISGGCSLILDRIEVL